MTKPVILVIAGPTAVGKTEYAIRAARAFNGEIVSCDSMQLYRFMNIGSAKPTPEEQSQAVHHLIDFVDPREEFSVAEYEKLAVETIDDILRRGKLPVVAGGTGLYLNSIIYDMGFTDTPKVSALRESLEQIASEKGGLILHEMLKERDLDAAERIHPNNIRKLIRAIERHEMGETKLKPFSRIGEESLRYDAVLTCLTRDRAELYDRINRRVDILFDKGLVEEVKGLMDMGLTSENISMKGIGYKEIIDFLGGNGTIEEAAELVKKNTRHYAKRQLTWMRRYENMHWINLSEQYEPERVIEEIGTCLKEKLK